MGVGDQFILAWCVAGDSAPCRAQLRGVSTVKDLITRAADEYDPRTETVTDLRVRLAKLLNTNQIYDTSIDDIEVYRERGAIVIDANYEKRFPLFWILDGVMRFEDLIVETAPTGRT